jgi:6-phosphogluconolactonase
MALANQSREEALFNRRTFLSLAASGIAASRLASAQQASGTVALYANVGPDLTHYDLDVANAELSKKATLTLPAGVQYAWPHASRRYLYVASSSSASGYGPAGTEHHVTALRIDPDTGALSPHGAPIQLPTRPIHISTDIPSENILVAFNNPSAVRVYRIKPDFAPGEEVMQPGPIDAGIFAHQVRTTPDNRLAILVTRGNEGTPSKPEDPGALKVFDYKNGVLTNKVSVAPNGGKGFGPRHLDFHPSKPWMYVSVETQNEMYMYGMENGRINPEIAYRAGTLAEPNNIRARQAAGTVRVHPNGRFLYGANPIQHIATQKLHPRTFHIDPSGRLLVAQHNLPVNVRDGKAVKEIPAGLSVFRIGDDGKLTFVRTYDIDVGKKTMFWMGMVPL